MMMAIERREFLPDHRGEDLSALVYTSRATADFDSSSLSDLVRAAQHRNALRNVTGVVYYRDGQFLQWLEGPSRSVYQLAQTISQDDRHTDIQLLAYSSTPARMFGDWNMHLIARPGDVPDALHKALEAKSGFPFQPSALEAARALSLGDEELATALMTARGAGLAAQVEASEAIVAAYASLWSADLCDSTDLTIGLCKLLCLFRRQSRVRHEPAVGRLKAPVLVIPLPGEEHHIGAAIAAETVRSAGFSVTYAFPHNPRDVVALLRKAPFESLVLAVSGVIARPDHAEVMENLAVAAKAECGPGLQTVVYGRLAMNPPPGLLSGAINSCTASANELPLLLTPAAHRFH